MLSPITQVTPAQPAAKPAEAIKATPPAKPQPAPTDTVTLSAAASTRQEITETPAQTAREANNGDNQAKRLLAKEAADSKL